MGRVVLGRVVFGAEKPDQSSFYNLRISLIREYPRSTQQQNSSHHHNSRYSDIFLMSEQSNELRQRSVAGKSAAENQVSLSEVIELLLSYLSRK